ncbi:hypothetical protein K1719_036916 [Acacia pycnantha]|nr:hypothetical protein K1719_036916 [Acacia pycnantha]
MERIVEEYLGVRGVPISREISMSNWDDEYLSDDQVLQITLDAHWVPADGRCLFRAIAHGACLRNGEEVPDENR